MQPDTNKPLHLDPTQLNAVYEAFYKYSGHAIAILKGTDDGSDFLILEANPSECRFTDRPREELVGRRLTEAYPNASQTGIMELIRQVWTDGETRRFDPTFYRDARLSIWISGYICKLPGDCVLVVCEDVTDDTLRHQQQELELTVLSELRNTTDLALVIPVILSQIKAYARATHVFLYLCPEYQTGSHTTPKNCSWTYCETDACLCAPLYRKNGELLYPHKKVLAGEKHSNRPFFTRDGSFWCKNLEGLQECPEFTSCCPDKQIMPAHIKSGCIVALRSGDEILGLMQVVSEEAYSLTEKQVEFLEVLGASIGMALGHQHVEYQLRLNEQKMSTILNSMPAMLAAFDGKGHILYWNKECERITGYTSQEVVNNPEIKKLLYPDPEYREHVSKTLGEIKGDFKNQEFILTDKQGEPHIISWANVAHSMPVPGWHTWAIGLDVTQSKKNERVLQGILTGTARETGTLFFRNLAQTLAQTLGVKYAMVSEMLINLPGAVGTRAIWAGKDFGDNFIYNIENTPCAKVAEENLCIFDHNDTHIFPKDHPLIDMGIKSYAGASLLDAEGNLLGILAVMDDKPLQEAELISTILQIFSARAAAELERQHAVEEQQRLEAKLRMSQKMEAIGQLAGGIAHDFNNLLQAISGYTELATYALEPSHAARNDLKEVTSASNRARDLIQQLLSFSSRQILRPEVLDVNEVVNQTCNMIRRIIGEQIDFEFFPSDDIQPIRADRGQLDQIIINLCVNARDAMPNGGQLRIKTGSLIADEPYCSTHTGALPGSYTCISISDTGIGMPSDVKEHIFEPFFSTKGLGKGTGLGLSTVYGIVAQHKGFINVETAPSSGTTFEIYLPVNGIMQKPEGAVLKEVDLEIRGKGETILFAEDEEVVRKLGTTILQNAGYKVLPAYDGEKALELFDKYEDEISFVVLDVVMPRKSGPDVCRVIKEKHPKLPVLFATGYSFSLLENEIPHEGCEIISKPFTPHKLLKTINDMLSAATPNEP